MPVQVIDITCNSKMITNKSTRKIQKSQRSRTSKPVFQLNENNIEIFKKLLLQAIIIRVIFKVAPCYTSLTIS